MTVVRHVATMLTAGPAHYRFGPGGVEMFVYRQWFAVSPHTIHYRALPGDSGETSGGHWCGSFGSDAPSEIVLIYTRCAILPPQAASVQLGRAVP
jgi:hypothetical protein